MRLDGFEESLALATRRSGEIATVTNWESEEALRATEGPSYWLRAFSAGAASGEVNRLGQVRGRLLEGVASAALV